MNRFFNFRYIICIIIVTSTIIGVIILQKVQYILFGYGPTNKGGEIGRHFDNYYRHIAYLSTVQYKFEKYTNAITTSYNYNYDNSTSTSTTLLPVPVLVISLPNLYDPTANARGAKVLLNSYYIEYTIRTIYRRWHVQEYLQSNNNNINNNINNIQMKNKDDTKKCCQYYHLPLLQPNIGNWYRYIDWNTNIDNSTKEQLQIQIQQQQSTKNRYEVTIRNLHHQQHQHHHHHQQQKIFHQLIFSEEDIVVLLQTNFSSLYYGLYQYLEYESTNDDNHILLFGIVALYYYGGTFISHTIRRKDEIIIQLSSLSDDQYIYNSQLNCWLSSSSSSSTTTTDTNTSTIDDNDNGNILLSKFSTMSNNNTNNKQTKVLDVVVATQYHPHLKCVLFELSTLYNWISTSTSSSSSSSSSNSDNNNNNKVVPVVFDLSTILYHYMNQSNWDSSMKKSATCATTCCFLQNDLINQILMDATEVEEESLLDDDEYNEMNTTTANSNKNEKRFHVAVVEQQLHDLTTGSTTPRAEKIRLSQVLQTNKCSSGWLCNRCLRMPYYGSIMKCSRFCRTCYQRTICNSSIDNKRSGGSDIEKQRQIQQNTKSVVIFDVSVKENKQQQQQQQQQQKRIPRIIHQTWFEEISVTVYPHLHRMQQSWITSGWEYKLYTDEMCRVFIIEHYPKLVIDAYDTILPGAFKADLFRLLVLFIYGGIYADIDVQLDINLDYFITSTMGLFFPRDVPLDYWPNSNYCIWNGLLGSAPGHPIIGQAIVDVINTINNRIDYLDIEQSLCNKNYNTAIWKLRTLPVLLLTGPCRLGMSVNTAIGRTDPLHGFDLGWLNTTTIKLPTSQPDDNKNMNYFWGDTLVLLSDRNDLGELRFTDIDRNLLIASSNQNKISKTPIHDSTIQQQQQQQQQQQKEQQEQSLQPIKKESIHYSKSESDIVGEYNTYADRLSKNLDIQIRIQHSYTT